jgi:hypothetical protein
VSYFLLAFLQPVHTQDSAAQLTGPGAEVMGIFMSSRLPKNVLAHIWSASCLCDATLSNLPMH